MDWPPSNRVAVLATLSGKARRLTRDGKLELDDAIADPLPDYPNREICN